MHEVTSAFLLGLPALLSIVNPLSGAFIFRNVTAGQDAADRAHVARLVGIYSFAIMTGALLGGSYVLAFFGVGLPALRIGGGFVVALNAWSLLNAPEQYEARKQAQAPVTDNTASFDTLKEQAFFPLTMPITTGPGTIAVAVALGSSHPGKLYAGASYLLGLTVAAGVVAATVWIAYRFADPVVRRLGRDGSRIISRLTAFLLLCIGVQILIVGVQGVLGPLLAHGH